MSIDLRTRNDADQTDVSATTFFTSDLPEAFAQHRDVLAAADGIKLIPLTVETEEGTWSLSRDPSRDLGRHLGGEPGKFAVERGAAGTGAHVRLERDQLTDLVNDQTTPIAFMTAGRLDMPRGHIGHLLDWWLVLRSALDGRPVHAPGAVELREADGRSLDLDRAFTLDSSNDDMRHFLEQAGFLHIRGMFTEEEMAEAAADMDRAAPSYSPDDGNSWWARTSNGGERLVRMQGFDEHSELTCALISNDRFQRIGDIPGIGHVHAGLEGNRIEALTKPIGVVEGISDVPWHKDCSLGRHSYECCSLTVGISVTGADDGSGQLRVIAGSNRALVRPSVLDPSHLDLPDMALPTRTGDVTVHCSCTLHMAQPPIERERRVMYTSFRLPVPDREAAAAHRARLRTARESAPLTVSQAAGHTG